MRGRGRGGSQTTVGRRLAKAPRAAAARKEQHLQGALWDVRGHEAPAKVAAVEPAYALQGHAAVQNGSIGAGQTGKGQTRGRTFRSNASPLSSLSSSFLPSFVSKLTHFFSAQCKLLLEDESRQVKSLEAEKNTLERYVTELAEEMERETAQMVQVKQQIVEQVQQQLKLTEEEEDERPTTKKEERDELVVETYPVNSIEQEIERVKRTYDLALPTIDDEEYEEEQDRMERRGRELKRQAWKEERQTQLHNEQEAALKRENEELKRSERELRERVMRAEKELAQMAELRRQQQVELMVKDEHIDICEHEIEELSEKLEVKDKCITVLKKDIARLQEKRKRQKESGRRGEVDILSFAPLSTASRQRHNSVAVLPLSTSSILSNGNAHERNEDEEVEGDDDEVIIRPRRAVSVFASPLSSATSNSSSPIASSASSSSWLEGSHSQKRSPSSPVSNFRLGSRSSPPSASPTPSSASSPRLANERSDTISSFWEQLWK
ncbi:hypothetical protein QOT17_004439 [Balamuthia mandrillaris]